MQVEGKDGASIELPHSSPNGINFGQVIVNERSVKSIALVNSGDVNYDFKWDVGTNPRISVYPESGTVAMGQRFACDLCYHPHVPEKLESYRTVCKVANGPRYILDLNGVCHKPRLDISFYRHDFGTVFLFQQGMNPNVKSLRVRNGDIDDISFELHFDSNEDIQVECPPTILAPGDYRDMNVVFTPTRQGVIDGTLKLEVNGLYTVNIFVRGEGTPLRVELEKPSQKNVKLGAIEQHSSATKVVKIINRSKISATVSLLPSADRFRERGIDMLPAVDMFLRPRESGDVTLFFRPGGRQPHFQENFEVDVANIRMCLFSVSGACIGTEVRLAGNSIPFGPVTKGSRASKFMKLENTGDTGTKFSWETSRLTPNFSLFPSEGFLSPGRDVTLDITFHPEAVSADIRLERVRCRINGGQDQFLTLTGSCVESEAESEELLFSCVVRASLQKHISMSNDSNTNWLLRPVIQNDYWSGPEFMNVPAQSSADYPITYSPLTMSSKDKPHTGSIFFPIPDGTGKLFNLKGVAENPVAEDTISRTLPSKTQHVEELKVSNWVQRPQRFKVSIEKIQCHPSTVIQGAGYIDVPPLSKKIYKVNYCSYTEGVTSARVSFTNESTGEYLFYELQLTAGPAPVQGSIALECPVRTQTQNTIRILNPLESAVVMQGTSTDSQVVLPNDITLKPAGVCEVQLAYRPLLVAEKKAALVLKCEELGVYEYELSLKGVPAGPEQSLSFSVPLGSQETQMFRFTHWLNSKVEYKCYFRSGSSAGTGDSPFGCPAAVTAEAAGSGGRKIEMPVTFEPEMLGENARDTLIVVSSEAGQYECPVVGNCVQPKPQGPVDVSRGSATVQFKNVFAGEAEFLYTVDNPAFSAKASEKIGAKKTTTIPIAYKQEGSNGPTGRLAITCPSKTESTWVYYLRG
ncbi:unnamed protein product [Ostreobium quekettii]|uniref:HYDIN/VesB/CFA65-like Ig-like domain-containing protein n=1 Tax=Ostreobium quekettii TaxID=121088 RepID=A0A8S1J062_9CHLO|nr:unnamed protein product [Ostreobium quekettii]